MRDPPPPQPVLLWKNPSRLVLSLICAFSMMSMIKAPPTCHLEPGFLVLLILLLCIAVIREDHELCKITNYGDANVQRWDDLILGFWISDWASLWHADWLQTSSLDILLSERDELNFAERCTRLCHAPSGKTRLYSVDIRSTGTGEQLGFVIKKKMNNLTGISCLQFNGNVWITSKTSYDK